MRVVKSSAKNWEIGDYIDYNPVGCLRHVDIVDTKDGDGGMGKITEQEWIEGSSLVNHMFMERDYLEDNIEGKENVKEIMNNGNGLDTKKFGVDSRIVVTFYQGKFLYRERVSTS